MKLLKKQKCNQKFDEHFEKKTNVIGILMKALGKHVIRIVMKMLTTKM